MGDRINIGFKNNGDDPIIGLYMHWGGSEAKESLAQALVEANSRWHDPEYATRIAISYMIGDNWKDTTGYGLFVTDDLRSEENGSILVNWDEGNVAVTKRGERKVSTIAEFIKKYGC